MLKHFIDAYPNEAVGYVDSQGEFHALENLSTDPNAWQVAPDTMFLDIKVLLHSHCVQDLSDPARLPDGTPYASTDARCPSKEDLQAQVNSGLEFAIVVTDGKDAFITPSWGNPATRPPLEGREYIGNLNDCFTLVQDYMYQTRGIVLENLPRDVWFEEALVDENSHKYGCQQVKLSELKPGDVIAYAVRTPTPRHLGIYLGGNRVLSHWNHRLSGIEDAGKFARYAVYGLRLGEQE